MSPIPAFGSTPFETNLLFLCFCVKACHDYEALRVAALLLPGKKQQEPKLKAVF